MGGPVSDSNIGMQMSKVVHAIDLTYNGSSIGELHGDQLTVEGFLGALNSARLSS